MSFILCLNFRILPPIPPPPPPRGWGESPPLKTVPYLCESPSEKHPEQGFKGRPKDTLNITGDEVHYSYPKCGLYAVKAETSLAPLSRFQGSLVTTAHAHQCCRFQSYAKTVPSRMKLTSEMDKA